MGVQVADKTLRDPSARGVRRIGIHGPRNAGKTCYLACLYGARAGDAQHVCFGDGDGLAYLADVWKNLEQQQLPAATRGMPTDIRLDLEDTVAKRTWAMMLRDYPGALVQPIGQGATPLDRQLSATVKQWVAESHALLVFVDSSDPSVEQVDAIDLLLAELRRESANGYTLERPVGLVLTKWDRVNPTFGSAKEEEERARAYLHDHPVLKQVYRKLCDSGEKIRVFPVSAFGSEAKDQRPPAPDLLRPYNLFAPLQWAVEKADEVLLDQAQAEAQKRLQPCGLVPRRPFHYLADCKSAAQVYEQLQRDYLMDDGPPAARIARELRAIRGQRRKCWTALIVIPLLLLIAGGAATAYFGMQRDERRIRQLSAFLQDHRKREDAPIRAAAEEAYLRSWTSWLNVRYRREVRSWLATDLQTAQVVDEFRAARTRERTLHSDNKFADAITAYREFIVTHEGTPEASDAEARIIDLMPLVDDFAEYETLRQSAAPRTPAALEVAYAKARDYERTPRSRKQMTESVRAFREWFERLQKPGVYFVEVTSVTIPKGSDLDAFWGTKPRVILEMNGERHETEWFRGNTPLIGTRLGPYPFRWGEPGTLRIRVEGHHTVLKNDRVERSEDDAKFILGKANGPFTLTCAKKKTITVHLRCSQAEPPELPPYSAH